MREKSCFFFFFLFQMQLADALLLFRALDMSVSTHYNLSVSTPSRLWQLVIHTCRTWELFSDGKTWRAYRDKQIARTATKHIQPIFKERLNQRIWSTYVNVFVLYAGYKVKLCNLFYMWAMKWEYVQNCWEEAGGVRHFSDEDQRQVFRFIMFTPALCNAFNRFTSGEYQKNYVVKDVFLNHWDNSCLRCQATA